MSSPQRAAEHPIGYYLRSFRFHSVLWKYYMLVFVFLYVPLVGTVLGVTSHYSNRVRQEIEAAYGTTVSQAGVLLRNALSQADVDLFRLSRSETVSEFVAVTDMERPGYETMLVYDQLTRELSQSRRDPVTTVYVASHRNGYFVNSVPTRGRIDDARAPEGLRDGAQPNSDWLLWRFHEGEIQLSRPTWGPEAGQVDGIVLATIGTSSLVDSIASLSLGDDAEIYLVTDDGRIIDSNVRSATNRAVNGKNVRRLLERAGGSFETVSRGEAEYAVFTREGYRGLVYMIAVDTNHFFGSIRKTNRVVFWATAIFALATIPLVFAIAVHLYNPVKRLLQVVEDAELASRDDASTANYDEIKYITENILRSLDRSREMEHELHRRMTMLNRAQVAALQTQINPHFLNNTLSTINWLAKGLTGGKDNEVTGVVESLSRLMRTSMESEGTLTTLREEISHAATYLEIQQTRYRGMIDVSWKVPRELLDQRIVRITLQPLVENAIYHGIKPRRRGRIDISAETENGRCMISVTDDGVGAAADEIEDLNAGFSREDYAAGGTHIGLSNVNQRLKLVFGEEAGLHLSPRRPSGLEVKITIPRSR